MSTFLVIVILAVIIFILLSLYFKKLSREQELEAQLDHAKKAMQGVADAIHQKKQVEAEAEKPVPVPSADAGDSASRLDRLNKL